MGCRYIYLQPDKDYLKYDNCFLREFDEPEIIRIQNKLNVLGFKAMSDAIEKNNWNVHYSMCVWGHGSPWLWGKII